MSSLLGSGIFAQNDSLKLDDLVRLDSIPEMEQADWLVEKITRHSQIFRVGDSHIVMDNGLVQRSFLVEPNLGCISFTLGHQRNELLRSVRPEARLSIDGTIYQVGGLDGQGIGNFFSERDLLRLKANPESFRFQGLAVSKIKPRMAWKRRENWASTQYPWPPPGLRLQLRFKPPHSNSSNIGLDGLEIDVHYEIYDGIPLICKWVSIRNQTRRQVHIDAIVSEILACVEAGSQVEDLADPKFPNLHVETDYTTCSMEGTTAQVDSVRWLPDPNYDSQVNYKKESRCLLECGPNVGPDVDLAEGETLESIRTWIMPLENRDEIRRALSLCRMYQTIAPWTTENPMIHHVRNADTAAVRLAIDQSAEVGFEMVLITFGSGFDIENESPDYLKQIKELADYAHQKNIALGGYSLLASRSVGPEDDVINPETGKPGGFARFGNSPCLESRWGHDYFRKLTQFFQATDCDVLEHDGSYPGDACASRDHPGHHGLGDSRWRQWKRVTTFYQWCRGRGIYLNVPDWYFLNGSNKTGMGYRETNWSLPREDQEIIERQNIFDGTKFKLPSMGWMFVPLTEYHGGGEAATIEPLNEHLDHYERRLQNLLGAGVQACFRGPRLFDNDQTREMVKRWVDWYKANRAILDSPIVPLRRADGRDWDGWLHVNPTLQERGMAVLYNPTAQSLDRLVAFPLYYTGIRTTVQIEWPDGSVQIHPLDSDHRVRISVRIPAHGMLWLRFTQ